MKLTRIHIHNYRSIIDVNIDAHDFIMFVGANNAGKSNCINALRCFYGELSWTEDDFPKIGARDQESWVQLSFDLSNDAWKVEPNQKPLQILQALQTKQIKANRLDLLREIFFRVLNIQTTGNGNI